MEQTTAVAVVPAQKYELTVEDVLGRQKLIGDVLSRVMVRGMHYGVIPGMKGEDGKPPKPILYKVGAEKLATVFRLAPQYDTVREDLPGGHREYLVTCTLTHIGTGVIVGSGQGLCSTMEGKYRWRYASKACPECGADAIRKGRDGGYFCGTKNGGCGVNFEAGDRRIEEQGGPKKVENPDIADVFNTVLKMASKRALIAAVLTATSAGDMFATGETEDTGDDHDAGDEPRRQQKGGRRQQKAPQKSAEEEKRDALGQRLVAARNGLGYSWADLAEIIQSLGMGKVDKLGQISVEQLEKLVVNLEHERDEHREPAAAGEAPAQQAAGA